MNTKVPLYFLDISIYAYMQTQYRSKQTVRKKVQIKKLQNAGKQDIKMV